MALSQSWQELKRYFSIVTSSPPKSEQTLKKLDGLFRHNVVIKSFNQIDISNDKAIDSIQEKHKSVTEISSQNEKSHQRLKVNPNVTIPNQLFAKSPQPSHSKNSSVKLPPLHSPQTSSISYNNISPLISPKMSKQTKEPLSKQGLETNSTRKYLRIPIPPQKI